MLEKNVDMLSDGALQHTVVFQEDLWDMDTVDVTQMIADMVRYGQEYTFPGCVATAGMLDCHTVAYIAILQPLSATEDVLGNSYAQNVYKLTGERVIQWFTDRYQDETKNGHINVRDAAVFTMQYHIEEAAKIAPELLFDLSVLHGDYLPYEGDFEPIEREYSSTPDSCFVYSVDTALRNFQESATTDDARGAARTARDSVQHVTHSWEDNSNNFSEDARAVAYVSWSYYSEYSMNDYFIPVARYFCSLEEEYADLVIQTEWLDTLLLAHYMNAVRKMEYDPEFVDTPIAWRSSMLGSYLPSPEDFLQSVKNIEALLLDLPVDLEC